MGSNGMPVVSEEDMESAGAKVPIMLSVMMIVPRLIGCGIGFLIFKFGAHDSYKEQISFLAPKSLGFLYLSAALFSALVQWLNVFPMVYKEKLSMKGNLRANMQFFRVNTMDKPLPYVVLEEDGVIGNYNRANRSLFHFNENLGGVLLCLLCAGFVFPLPALICTSIFALGRVLHQIGYSSGGYGSHAPGFALAQLATASLEGLTTIAALSSFGVI